MLAAIFIIIFLFGISFGEIICKGDYLITIDSNYATLINKSITCSININESANVTWYLNNTIIKQDIGNYSYVNLTFDREGFYILSANVSQKNSSKIYNVGIISYNNLSIVRVEIFDTIMKKLLINTTSSNISGVNASYDVIKKVRKGYGYQSLALKVFFKGCIKNFSIIINGRSLNANYKKIDDVIEIFLRDKLKLYNNYNLSIILNGCFNETSKININNLSVYAYIVDELGNKIYLKTVPKRVVILAPDIFETFISLNLTNHIVGMDKYSIGTNITKVCNDLLSLGIYAKCIKPNATNVGGVIDFSVESIIGLNPDLILASGININLARDRLERLLQLNAKLFAWKSRKIIDIFDYMDIIGEIFNVSNYKSITNNLRNKVKGIVEKSSRIKEERKPKILYAVWYNPIYTTGRYTFANDLIELAGGINIFKDVIDREWFAAKVEEIINRNPDVIICSGMGNLGSWVCNSIKNDTALRVVSAVKRNRLYVIPDSNWIERTGPRIVLALEWLHDIVMKNLKQIKHYAPRTYEGGGVVEKYGEIFKERIQEMKDIEEVVREKFKYKVGYISREIFAPLLILDEKYPYVEFMKYSKRLDKDLFKYNYDVIMQKYYYTRTLIISRSDLAVDSYAATLLAKRIKAPILFINGSNIPDILESVLEKLPNLKNIIIIGGDKAVPYSIEEKILSIRNLSVTRIYGNTRVETSIEIAKKLSPDKVIITGYKPSVKALILSIEYNAPIIYSSKYKIKEIIDFLKKYKPKILFVDIEEEMKDEIVKGIAEYYY